jgi:hypothetical protein
LPGFLRHKVQLAKRANPRTPGFEEEKIKGSLKIILRTIDEVAGLPLGPQNGTDWDV